MLSARSLLGQLRLPRARPEALGIVRECGASCAALAGALGTLARVPRSRYKSPVTATRPPARSPDYGHRPSELDELEELGDEAIISQQTAAHAPQPRANVSEESRSVVITERSDSRPPRTQPPKPSAEATLVIRDRRALDEMRQKIIRRQKQKEAHGRRALYLWCALGLVAFVLGGIVAFLATESRPSSPTADLPSGAPRSEVPLTQPSIPAAPRAANAPSAPPRAVRLNDLPVERKP